MKKYLFMLLFSTVLTGAYSQDSKEIIYVGTFSVRGSEGIYVCEFDRSRGKLNIIQTVNTLESPSFLAIHPSGNFLYSVNRGTAQDYKKPGSVSSYKIDKSTGKLTLLNYKPSYGMGPCHISIDQTGKLTFVSNYTEGSLTVLQLSEDGSIGDLTDSLRFTGSGTNKQRQEKPHIHSATLSPDNRFLMVADLGTDKVYSYAINTSTGKLTPSTKAYMEVQPGSGPRHFTFHPNGKYAYLAEELSSTVAAFAYKKETGTLELIQDQVKSLPDDFKGVNTSADIHVSNSGKYLIMSNRGHNSMAIFTINRNGKVTLKSIVNSQGEKPRNFLFDKSGEFVFVANQDTDNIVIYKLDAENDSLISTGEQLKIPSPVCMKMLKLQ